MPDYRLYPATNGPASSTADVNIYTMGLSFQVTSLGCELLGYWWWIADANQDNTAHQFALWTPTGAGTGTLVAGSALTSGALSLGWNLVSYGTPIALTSGTEYRAVIAIISTGFTAGYSATSHFWDSGAGTAGITNGPLSAYCSSGGSGTVEPQDAAQMVFNTGGSDPAVNYPSSSFNSTNYWLDVQVSAPAPPPPVPPAPVLYQMRTFP